mgnify:CR=1 FL=1
MVKYNLVADVSSYQPDTLVFFKALKNAGVKAVIIKLTEGSRDGSNYINPKAKQQKANAEKAGLLVHAYHYAKYNGVKDAENEADFFTSVAKQLGFSKKCVLADDVEDSSQKKDCTEDTKAFLNRIKKNGYPNVDLYTMASWVWSKRINLAKIGKINLWIANYGASQPNVDNVGTWQYTSSFPILGKGIDMSYDFNGYYTKAKTTPAKKSKSEWVKKNGTFTLGQSLEIHKSPHVEAEAIAKLKKGDIIKFDATLQGSKRLWLRQPRSGGTYGYIVARDKYNKPLGKIN